MSTKNILRFISKRGKLIIILAYVLSILSLYVGFAYAAYKDGAAASGAPAIQSPTASMPPSAAKNNTGRQ